jgi:hypothetical protein
LKWAPTFIKLWIDYVVSNGTLIWLLMVEVPFYQIYSYRINNKFWHPFLNRIDSVDQKSWIKTCELEVSSSFLHILGRLARALS